jgi:predicted CoA-substrate-specific enzyme activase
MQHAKGESMYYIGIDIGSTASKIAVLQNDFTYFTIPTGWNSKETSKVIQKKLMEDGIDVFCNNVSVVATGYGRISVSYANAIVTEISCHGKGGLYLFGQDCSVVDVGGQDTKVITMEQGAVSDFLMNDKCSAGTGKFLEIMANRLGITIDELFDMAQKGKVIPISSLCTVFAESEIINFMGEGRDKEDIAAGVVDSVANKVASLCQRHRLSKDVIITGGISHSIYFAKLLSQKLKTDVIPMAQGRYAGAIGAALIAREKFPSPSFM